jgi:hypothetical protein
MGGGCFCQMHLLTLGEQPRTAYFVFSELVTTAERDTQEKEWRKHLRALRRLNRVTLSRSLTGRTGEAGVKSL